MLDLRQVRENPTLIEKGLLRRGLRVDLTSLKNDCQKLKKLEQQRSELQSEGNIIGKEVGQKILSDKGSKLYNGFVVKIQTFYNVKNVISLNESDFWPQPNIKSILIKLENKNRKLLSNLSYKEYTKFLFNCFKVRRKKLSNNLQMYFTKEAINDNLNNLELKQDIRAQDIDDDTFLKLFKNLTDSKS